MAIPHVIHYFWFGEKPLSDMAQRCIASWRKYLPDYEIKEWNESNFDVNMIPFTSQAYSVGKYAFVSDYARLWVLYNYGGIYMDVDVEMIKDPSEIFKRGSFVGTEKSVAVNNDLFIAGGSCFGVSPYSPILKGLLDVYAKEFFIINNKYNVTTINSRMTDYFLSLGWSRENRIQKVGDMFVYPTVYFSPYDWLSKKMRKTEFTYCIHWFSGSWMPVRRLDRIKGWLYRIIPDPILIFYYNHKKNV